MTSLDELVVEWDRSASEGDYPSHTYVKLRDRVRYLGEQLFGSYEPTWRASEPLFEERLVNWVTSAPKDADRITLVEAVEALVFIGSAEAGALLDAAFNGPVARWLLQLCSLELKGQSTGDDLKNAVTETWFCPATDSLQISSFYHRNQIAGVDLRPDWRSLLQFGARDKILKYMGDEGFDKIVILEDFVATGMQVSESLRFAAGLGPPVLFVPLAIAPEGLQSLRDVAAVTSNLDVEPVWILPKEAFLLPADLSAPAESLGNRLLELADRLHHLVLGSGSADVDYGPYGYGEFGSLVVMHSNCPDNTLPLIHWKSDTWCPVFPRSPRL